MKKEKGKLDNLYHIMTLSRGIEQFEAVGKIKKYPKDYNLNRVDEFQDYCYIVKSGRVISYEYSDSGERRLYKFLEPGALFMEEFILLDRACPVLFKTAVPSELILLDKRGLKKAMESDPEIMMYVAESMATKFISAMEEIRRGQRYSATWKICKLLQIFVETYGEEFDGKILIKEKISQQMVSDMLGMNRITVTRKFKELREMGLLWQINGYYCVNDWDSLSTFMDELELNYENK